MAQSGGKRTWPNGSVCRRRFATKLSQRQQVAFKTKATSCDPSISELRNFGERFLADVVGGQCGVQADEPLDERLVNVDDARPVVVMRPLL